MKHLQLNMNTFELNYRKYEQLPQRQQLSTIFKSTIEEVFEALETVDVCMSTAHSMIEPIVNRNFGNIFDHRNGPNQHQRIHKHYSILSTQIISKTKDLINSIPERILPWVWTQQTMS